MLLGQRDSPSFFWYGLTWNSGHLVEEHLVIHLYLKETHSRHMALTASALDFEPNVLTLCNNLLYLSGIESSIIVFLQNCVKQPELRNAPKTNENHNINLEVVRG